MLSVDVCDALVAAAYEGNWYSSGNSLRMVSSLVIWLVSVPAESKDP